MTLLSVLYTFAAVVSPASPLVSHSAPGVDILDASKQTARKESLEEAENMGDFKIEDEKEDDAISPERRRLVSLPETHHIASFVSDLVDIKEVWKLGKGGNVCKPLVLKFAFLLTKDAWNWKEESKKAAGEGKEDKNSNMSPEQRRAKFNMIRCMMEETHEDIAEFLYEHGMDGAEFFWSLQSTWFKFLLIFSSIVVTVSVFFYMPWNIALGCLLFIPLLCIA